MSEVFFPALFPGFEPPEELAQVEAAVRSCQPFDEVLHTRAGCTVSSHCGPRTLGILYFHTK